MIKKRKIFFLFFFLIILFFFNIFKKKENFKYYVKKNQNDDIVNLNYNKIINNENLNYEKIKINTDLLSLIINTNSGIIEEATLLKFKKELNSSELFKLLKTNNKFIYQIKNDLIENKYLFNNLNETINPKFKVVENNYTIINNKNYIVIPMYYKDINNNIFIKTFVLKRNSYEIKIINTFINNNIIPLKLSCFGQIKQTINKSINKKNNENINKNLKWIAYSNNLNKYKKISFNDDIKLNINTKTGWIAMLQKYFITAIVPNKMKNVFYTEKLNNNYTIGFQSNLINIKPFEIKNYKISLWIGPKLQNDMEKLSPYLSKTIDYGILWFISKPLFKLLKFIYLIIGNWGFAIILITLLLRIIIYPISKFQYIYLKKTKMLIPKIKKIEKKYKNNQKILNLKILKLYEIEKINPLFSLIPALIQMPIFLALYNMLIESVELRHAKFIFWINDLSSKDPYFILPILLSITIYYIQKISSINSNNSLSEKITAYMPIILSFFFFWFPSGLIVYYIVNNIFIILQQKKYLK